MFFSFQSYASEYDLQITKVVETNDAIYFEPESDLHRNIIYYFPKTEVLVEPFLATIKKNTIHVSARLQKLTKRIPEQLHISWKGKLLRPYTLIAQQDCEINVDSSIRIEQFLSARGKTLFGIPDTIICDYFLQTNELDFESKLSEVRRLNFKKKLLNTNLTLNLKTPIIDQRLISLTDLHDFLKTTLELSSDILFSIDEAMFLLGISLGYIDDIKADEQSMLDILMTEILPQQYVLRDSIQTNPTREQYEIIQYTL